MMISRWITRSGSNTSRRRNGSILLESLIALILLLMVIGLAAQTSVTTIRQRRALRQDRFAFDAKSNVTTFAMALRYDQVTESTLREYAESLTEDPTDWQIEVTDLTVSEVPEQKSPTGGKKIEVGLSSGKRNSPTLVCWRFPTEETEDSP